MNNLLGQSTIYKCIILNDGTKLFIERSEAKKLVEEGKARYEYDAG